MKHGCSVAPSGPCECHMAPTPSCQSRPFSPRHRPRTLRFVKSSEFHPGGTPGGVGRGRREGSEGSARRPVRSSPTHSWAWSLRRGARAAPTVDHAAWILTVPDDHADILWSSSGAHGRPRGGRAQEAQTAVPAQREVLPSHARRADEVVDEPTDSRRLRRAHWLRGYDMWLSR